MSEVKVLGKKNLNDLKAKGYIKNNEPVKCRHCGDTGIVEVIQEQEGNEVSEKDFVCKSCGCVLGSWAYGLIEFY